MLAAGTAAAPDSTLTLGALLFLECLRRLLDALTLLSLLLLLLELELDELDELDEVEEELELEELVLGLRPRRFFFPLLDFFTGFFFAGTAFLAGGLGERAHTFTSMGISVLTRALHSR